MAFRMRNLFPVLAVLLGSCGSFPVPNPAAPIATILVGNYIETVPVANELIIVGVAPIYGYSDEVKPGVYRSARQRSIDEALDDAAQKASYFFNGAHTTGFIYEKIGESFFDYDFQSEVAVGTIAPYEQYRELLKFNEETDVDFRERIVFVRTRIAAPSGFSVGYIPSSKDHPEWIDNMPSTISGYRAALGYANKRSSMYESVIKSYKNGAIAFAASNVQSNIIDYQNSASGSGSDRTNSNSIDDIVRGFYVLETWINPETQQVYSLVIAQSLGSESAPF